MERDPENDPLLVRMISMGVSPNGPRYAQIGSSPADEAVNFGSASKVVIDQDDPEPRISRIGSPGQNTSTPRPSCWKRSLGTSAFRYGVLSCVKEGPPLG